MKLTFLGTGTSQGVPIIGCDCQVCKSPDFHDKRLRTSAMITCCGNNIVIDAGPDFRQQMLVNHVNTLRAILLTHEHADHIFGLDDIRAYNWIQKKPMDIFSEQRVHEAIRRIFDYVFAKWKYPGIPMMELYTIGEEPFFIDNMEFIPIRCFHHKLPVLGFRTGNLTYLTDVSSIPDKEIDKIRGSEVLVVNALRHEKHISHFSLQEALQLHEEVSPRQTYLTHISHRLGLHAEISKILPPGVFPAYDGQEITI
jgi:phosphoribosyl 1,2-cyclic phosphate phosphodiesterase